MQADCIQRLPMEIADYSRLHRTGLPRIWTQRTTVGWCVPLFRSPAAQRGRTTRAVQSAFLLQTLTNSSIFGLKKLLITNRFLFIYYYYFFLTIVIILQILIKETLRNRVNQNRNDLKIFLTKKSCLCIL